ncbi:cyclic nucleotide-binding domain-containing protein [Simiduia sp. 21SJ11W-1]|uniref:cyclic nucleotide-binding domain-containing protein n=1 Tax=Simiduia sp. 21SJ11W-1 TaxID=2909669 RepID=UPI0020A23093|nr:cyclic nucleotide-binding domain-containing protein [Simiduia sp. 21SJ11W-1]UTA47290.1 cyclic nucleotide-binding domain-containing protein [Simiduia sp. 21SJ11W-1]
MEIKTLSRIPRADLESLLAPIPFYKAVKQDDPQQFEVLLRHSRLVEFKPGEVVLRRGERDPWLYFLLKGQLAVFANDAQGQQVVNYITPGEVFGDLAALVQQERSATVIADHNCKQVLVFGTDFKAFGALENFGVISLATKLAYYRNCVHSLRWKLEVYRMRYPDNPLASRHRAIKLYSGPKGGREELRAIHEQAQALAKLLLSWNQEFGSLSLAAEGHSAPNPALVDKMTS